MTIPVDIHRIRLQTVPRIVILDVARRIGASFRPLRIVLFGSYAYGDPTPDSDVDMLVIMDTDLSETDQAVEIILVIEPRFGLDLLVRTPRSLDRRLALGDPFLREVVERGEVIYEPDSPTLRRAHSAMECPKLAGPSSRAWTDAARSRQSPIDQT